MTPKVLSQSGISLADSYDVEGSIAGVEELLTRDIILVHEMGSTLFSERASGEIRRVSTGAVAQSTSINVVLTDLPANLTRILGVQVINSVGTSIARIAQGLTVSVRDPIVGQEMPIWIWDLTVADCRIMDADVVASFELLRSEPVLTYLPSMLYGPDQPQHVGEVAFRGSTLAFGAGTVELVLLIYISYAQVAGISSYGLPIPAW